eukprot:jgi/Botrbrau1/15867/Bobra.40_1s0051.1
MESQRAVSDQVLKKEESSEAMMEVPKSGNIQIKFDKESPLVNTDEPGDTYLSNGSILPAGEVTLFNGSQNKKGAETTLADAEHVAGVVKERNIETVDTYEGMMKLVNMLKDCETELKNMGIEHKNEDKEKLKALYPAAKPVIERSERLALAIANSISGKTPDEIRELIGVVDDFTPEEREQVLWENHFDWGV